MCRQCVLGSGSRVVCILYVERDPVAATVDGVGKLAGKQTGLQGGHIWARRPGRQQDEKEMPQTPMGVELELARHGTWGMDEVGGWWTAAGGRATGS